MKIIFTNSIFNIKNREKIKIFFCSKEENKENLIDNVFKKYKEKENIIKNGTKITNIKKGILKNTKENYFSIRLINKEEKNWNIFFTVEGDDRKFFAEKTVTP